MSGNEPAGRATRWLTVAHEDTASAAGSGDVPVLATPTVLAIAESLCIEAAAGEVAAGETTVGSYAEIEHTRPSPVGARVEVEAALVARRDRQLEFTVAFRQDGGEVAWVSHRRTVVDRERFLDQLRRS